jgi:hypothetical protein
MNRKIVAAILFFLLVIVGVVLLLLTRTAQSPSESPALATDTPTVEEPVQQSQCVYTWAYESLPEISAEYQAAVQPLLSGIEARATAFGEACGAQDGSSSFGAMETDFYLRVPVPDLNDNDTLGNFIEEVLSITDGFAPPLVPGAMEGFVEFTFLNGTDQRIVRVQISLGKQLRGQGLHGAELLQAIDPR